MDRRSWVVLAVVACLAAACQSVDTTPVVRIGHVAPLTGSLVNLGRDNERGARMAIDELNARGVSIGGKRVRLELMSEDDAADPRRATAAAQRLVDAKVAGVVGHLNSGTTIPAAHIYHLAGVPHITPSAANPKLTRLGYATSFRVIADDLSLGGVLGKYAATAMGGRSFAVVDDRTAYGQGVAEAFEAGVREHGGRVVTREFTTDSARDFSAIVEQIGAQRPDVVFFGGMDVTAARLLLQMRQSQIAAKFLGGDGICTATLARLAADVATSDQVICAENGGIAPAKMAAYEDFKARFRAKYGAEVQLFAPHAYDAVNVMVAAMVEAGSSEPAKYLPVLARSNRYPGVTADISFDANGDLRDPPVTLFTYVRGERKLLKVVQ